MGSPMVQGAGAAGGGWRRGPQGLLPGRVLQRFLEQIIDEDGVVLADMDVPVICSDKFLQFLFFGVEVPQLQFIDRVAETTYREIPQVQFLEKVVDVPVECNVRCLVETVQKTVEVLQLALIDKVDDVPVVQVVVGVSWKVPLIQFIARVSGTSSLQRDGFLLHGCGGGEGCFRGFSAFFALLRVVLELSASFRSPRR